MNALLVICSLLVPTITGYLFVAWFLKDDERCGILDRLFFGFGAGLGLLGYVFFLFGIMDIPFSLPLIIVVQGLFSLFMLYNFFRYEGGLRRVLFRRASSLPVPDASSKTPGVLSGRGLWFYVAAFLLGWVFIKCVFVYYECMLRPVYSVDMWGHWASGAKFFFFERGLALDRTGWGYFGTGYRVDLGYPLHTTFLQVWTAMWIGDFNEVYVKAWASLYFFGVLGLLYVGIRREFGWVYAAVWVFFLSSSPLLTYHGIEGLSDLPISYYVFASLLCFWRYLKNEGSGSLMLSAVFIGMALLTKNEGLLFFIALAPALLFSIILKRRRLFAHAATFLFPFILIVGPWLLFKAVEGLGFARSTSGMAAEAVGFVDRTLKTAALPVGEAGPGGFIHLEVLPVLLEKVLLTANFNLVIVFWLVFTALGLRYVIKTDLKYLYIFLGLTMTLFLVLYLTTEAQFVSQATAIFRNILTYMPVIFLTAAILFARFWDSSASLDPGGE